MLSDSRQTTIRKKNKKILKLKLKLKKKLKDVSVDQHTKYYGFE
jgi:hypothetical protein